MDMKAFGRSTAGVPTQTYSASNFIGTPVPAIGSAGASPTQANMSSGGRMHTVIIIVALIAIGYALHHWFFEK